MPCAVGAAGWGETGDGAMDDRKRVGCAPGRRRAVDACGAGWRPGADDGVARRARSGCECGVERLLPYYFCAVRDGGFCGVKVAAPARSESELRPGGTKISGDSSWLCD